MPQYLSEIVMNTAPYHKNVVSLQPKSDKTDNMLKSFFRENRAFMLLSIVVFAAMGIALCAVDTKVLHLWLNTWHCSFADAFFRYYTSIADYLVWGCVIALLFYKVGDSLFVLSAYLGSGLITQIVKHIVHAPRPSVVFDLAKHPDALPLVEGVRLHVSNSFPSGHTTAFFAVFFAIALLITYRTKLHPVYKQLAQTLCFLLALLGGYSRIYLSQHFAADVFAGGLIAIVSVGCIWFGFAVLQQKYPRFYSWNLLSCMKKKN